jgi:hypothetical protein
VLTPCKQGLTPTPPRPRQQAVAGSAALCNRTRVRSKRRARAPRPDPMRRLRVRDRRAPSPPDQTDDRVPAGRAGSGVGPTSGAAAPGLVVPASGSHVPPPAPLGRPPNSALLRPGLSRLAGTWRPSAAMSFEHTALLVKAPAAGAGFPRHGAAGPMSSPQIAERVSVDRGADTRSLGVNAV